MKVYGIYDIRTLKAAKTSGINEFAFDFRPKSMNFIQSYKCASIISELYKSDDVIYLIFEEEKSFVISSILKELKEKLSLSNEKFINQFKLILINQNEFDFQNDFELDISLFYKGAVSSSVLKKIKKLKTIIIPYQLVESEFENNTLHNFINNLYTLIGSVNSIRIELNVDWTDNIIPSLSEYIDFDDFSIDINSNIEVCYRNVDLNKFNLSIEHLKALNTL